MGKKGKRPAISGGSSPYDDFVGIIADIVRREMEPMTAKLGTVSGKNGRRVRVDSWDEDGVSATEEYPRQGGTKHRGGDTVVLLPVGGGNYVALSPIANDRDDMISGDDIERDAIDERHIKQGSIKGKHIQRNSIGADELGRGFIEKNMLQGSFAGSLADTGSITRLDRRIDGVGSRIDNLMKRMKTVDGKDG